MADLPDRTKREEDLKRDLAAVALLYRDELSTGLHSLRFERDVQEKIKQAFVLVFLLSLDVSAEELGLAIGGQGAAEAWSRTYSTWLGGRISRQIQTAVGRPMFTQAERLQAMDEFLDPARWDALAATEVTRAAVAGGEFGANVALATKGRVATAIWHTEADNKVCPICLPLEGIERDVWQLYQPLGPPAHINCRCWISYSQAGEQN